MDTAGYRDGYCCWNVRFCWVLPWSTPAVHGAVSMHPECQHLPANLNFCQQFSYCSGNPRHKAKTRRSSRAGAGLRIQPWCLLPRTKGQRHTGQQLGQRQRLPGRQRFTHIVPHFHLELATRQGSHADGAVGRGVHQLEQAGVQRTNHPILPQPGDVVVHSNHAQARYLCDAAAACLVAVLGQVGDGFEDGFSVLARVLWGGVCHRVSSLCAHGAKAKP